MPAAPGPCPNPIADGLYRGVWRYAQGARVAMLASMALLMGSQPVRLAVPLFAAQAIGALQKGAPGSLGRALGWVGGVMGASIGSRLLHGPGRVPERRVGLRVREALSDELYTRLTAAPLGWHERHHSSDMQQRVRQSTLALDDFTANQFIYLQGLVGLVGPLLALFALSARLGLAALVAFGTLALLSMRIDRVLMRLSLQEMDAERRCGAGMADFLGHIGTLLSLRLQEASRRLLQLRLARIFVPLGRNIVINECKWRLVDLVSTLTTWALVVAYVHMLARGAGGGIAIGAVFRVQQDASRTAAVATDMTGRMQDEPTGALDPLTEAHIHDHLDTTFPGACIVASLHRMSLLAHFDRVALMEGGRLVDIGPLDELRARQPAFARMLAGGAHAARLP